MAAAAAAAALPEPVLLAPEQQEVDLPEEFWEAPLFARIETITAHADDANPGVSTENILSWCKPQYKGLTIYFSPEYRPSDETAWGESFYLQFSNYVYSSPCSLQHSVHVLVVATNTRHCFFWFLRHCPTGRLKADLQAAAAQQCFSLVSKGAKGKSPADKLRQVLICARGRTVPNSRKATNSMRPSEASECCRFRLTIHQDLNLDRFFVKGGQNNPAHKFHAKLQQDERPKKKRARVSRSSSTAAAAARALPQQSIAASNMATNVVWHQTALTRADRWKTHKGAVLWFTGLSGSGKSSIANEVEVLLAQRNFKTYLLDGDNLRHGLCSDLAFSQVDRNENLRRTAEVAKLMADAGMVVMAAFVSPYQSHREEVKNIVTSLSDIPFVEIYCKASLATCEKRDPKGLYIKARSGVIPNFTGITDPYETPTHPDIVLDADEDTVHNLADQVVQYLDFHGKLENN